MLDFWQTSPREPNEDDEDAVSQQPRVTRRDAARARRRWRIDVALMSGDDALLVWAAVDYWRARLHKLDAQHRRTASLRLVELADQIDTTEGVTR
jgi:hypothetical protein